MRNNDITKLLNIQGVIVKEIKFNENLEVYIKTEQKLQKCPHCNYHTKTIKDYYYNQKIQHTRICNKDTFLFLDKIRYKCNHCRTHLL